MRGKPRKESQWVRPTKPPCGSASTSARPSTSPTCWMRQDRRCSPAPIHGGGRGAARSVANDEAAIEALLARAESFGSPALVVDQPGSLARLVLGVAARRGVPVAYVPSGLVMRRAADLYPGESKTDRRDAFVLAEHRPHPAPPGALARLPPAKERRTPGAVAAAAARSQRLRHRPRRRRDAAHEPAARRPHRSLTGPGARTGPQTPQCGGTGPARPLPDTAGAGHGGSRPHRAGRCGSARRASRPRSPRPSPGPSTPRPWSYPARSRWVG